jgi:hypothetical protein
LRAANVWSVRSTRWNHDFDVVGSAKPATPPTSVVRMAVEVTADTDRFSAVMEGAPQHAAHP